MELFFNFTEKRLDLLRKDKLLKLKKKNRGNLKLFKAIDRLINDIEKSEWKNKLDVVESRHDADSVYGDNFFFFDLNVHRTMTLILFCEQTVEILWVGNHDEYEKTFKGNKSTIETWLRNHGKIK